MFPWYPRVADHDSTMLRIPPPQFIDSETISWISPCPGAKNPIHPLEFPDISPWSARGSTPGASRWHVHNFSNSQWIYGVRDFVMLQTMFAGFFFFAINIRGNTRYSKTGIPDQTDGIYTLFQTKMAKSIPYFRLEMLENDTLWGGTYLYGLYMGVPPPGSILANACGVSSPNGVCSILKRQIRINTGRRQ